MKYINLFKTHASYEEKLNGGGVDISLPNVSYCEDVKDVHFNPYNTVEFYVGDITGTTPQTVKIYTDTTNFDEVIVSEGNKWYTYALPKDKGLFKIVGNSIKKVVVKADISFEGWHGYPEYIIIPKSTVEASFKGSNTSKVTNMTTMFSYCRSLTSLDVSSFDTSKVTEMNNMFNACTGLTSLDLSSFDTSNVTNMGSMFGNCSSLTSLDLRNFNTSNVTDMSYMFGNCSSLTSLDLRNFNTSNVILMSFMFSACTGLTSLDLRNFNTSNVTDMSYMFSGCTSLTSLDVSGWDTSKVTSMDWMFSNCDALHEIKMKGCSEGTIQKITDVKPSGATIVTA